MDRSDQVVIHSPAFRITQERREVEFNFFSICRGYVGKSSAASIALVSRDAPVPPSRRRACGTSLFLLMAFISAEHRYVFEENTMFWTVFLFCDEDFMFGGVLGSLNVIFVGSLVTMCSGYSHG
jgi:hypothetical protein